MVPILTHISPLSCYSISIALKRITYLPLVLVSSKWEATFRKQQGGLGGALDAYFLSHNSFNAWRKLYVYSNNYIN